MALSSENLGTAMQVDTPWMSFVHRTTLRVLNSSPGVTFGITLLLWFQGVSAPLPSSAQPAERLRRTLAAVEETRGRSTMPPRLLQVNFTPAFVSGSIFLSIQLLDHLPYNGCWLFNALACLRYTGGCQREK